MVNVTETSADARGSRPRVARRYRTCAEALAAARVMEALLEEEVGELRRQGRETAADHRADAWASEIARALGEATALREAADRTTAPRTPGPTRQHRRSSLRTRSSGLSSRGGLPPNVRLLVSIGLGLARLWRRAPLAAALLVLVGGYLVVTVVRALDPYIGAIDVFACLAILLAIGVGFLDGWRTARSADRHGN